jgi:hypothetical protein
MNSYFNIAEEVLKNEALPKAQDTVKRKHQNHFGICAEKWPSQNISEGTIKAFTASILTDENPS